MADKAKKQAKKPADTAQNAPRAGDAKAPQFRVLAQYVKDLSFECPQAPYTLGDGQNDLGFNVSIASQAAGENRYEITLGLRGENKTADGKVAYLVELAYTGLFHIEGLPAQQTHMLMGADAPALLFPFARQLFMNTITEAGFRAPMIEPINFHALYMQQQQNQAAAASHVQQAGHA